MAESIVICADMDAFFASVEQQANPRLRGKPIAVIGSGGRTVVTTRSYEARRFGVKTGMNIYEAKKLCPQIIFVIGDNEKYTSTCVDLEGIYSRFTPDVEIYSIDEAFLDITTTHHLFGGPEAIGATIKETIRQRFGINCTVGIGPNVLIAKLVSDLAKPDGLRWVKEEEVVPLLEDLSVTELWGIGRRTANRLQSLGIKTCGDLGRTPVSLLRNKFGIIGETLKLMGMGICTRPLAVQPEAPKSIGHSMTFPRDILDRQELVAYLLHLSEMVGRRARKYSFIGGRVTVTIRYPDFETFTKQSTLSQHTNVTHDIYSAALSIIASIRLRDRVRLLGVSLSKLTLDSNQMSLLGDKLKEQALHRAMDAINARHGDFRITWASYLKQKVAPAVISPAWRPSGVRNLAVK